MPLPSAEFSASANPVASTCSIAANSAGSLGAVNVGGSDYLTISYEQVLFNTDITCTVQVSGNLTTWSFGPEFTALVSVVDHGDGTETVTVRDTTPISSATSQFIRVHISRP